VNKQTGNAFGDKLLVDKVLRGDTQAFGLIVRDTEALVAQIVFKMIPIAEDRKDIAQDTYLKAFSKLGGFKFQSKLSTWIAQIAYNSCLSWLAKKKLVLPGNLQEERIGRSVTNPTLGHRSAEVFHREPENDIIQKELAAILSTEIDSLPPVYQMLITLYHHESLTYDEMAQITGMPEGTVKSYLFRARKTLKENLLSKYKKEAL
jgi:RNA polymerase sigma factor (sigma-70 family)